MSIANNIMKLLSLILLLSGLVAQAQTIENFTLSNVTDNKKVSLSNYSASAGVLIIFTSNACPFDRYYADRIQKLSITYGAKVPVILINSLIDAEETDDAMKNHAFQYKIYLPYLADKDQVVLNQFNARKSPEVFLLKNNAAKFTVFYHGAIDDNPQSAEDVINAYLKNAIDQMLAGQKLQVVETRPVGCNIRKN